MSSVHPPPLRARLQAGVTSIEFALVALLVFFPLLLGCMELGRWLFTLNAAAETTRWGVRLAVVCDLNDERARQKMHDTLGEVADSLLIEYWPKDCTRETCTSVTASLANATFTPLIPYFGVTLPIPAFRSTLPREALDSAGSDNEVCL